MTFLLVDDHPMIRRSLQLHLAEFLPLTNVLQCSTFPAALDTLDQHEIDLVVLDIMLPGLENTQMVRLIKAKKPAVLILMYSAVDESVNALPYYLAGANGFLSKEAPEAEFETAIRELLNQGHYISPILRHRLLNTIGQKRQNMTYNPLLLLSANEQKVLDLLMEGKWTKEIAASLTLKVSTVSTYKKRIFEKLDVMNTTELIQKVNLFKYL